MTTKLTLEHFEAKFTEFEKQITEIVKHEIEFAFNKAEFTMVSRTAYDKTIRPSKKPRDLLKARFRDKCVIPDGVKNPYFSFYANEKELLTREWKKMYQIVSKRKKDIKTEWKKNEKTGNDELDYWYKPVWNIQTGEFEKYQTANIHSTTDSRLPRSPIQIQCNCCRSGQDLKKTQNRHCCSPSQLPEYFHKILRHRVRLHLLRGK